MDFRRDDLLAGLLDQRLGRIPLRASRRILLLMALQRAEMTRGLMMGRAKHDRRTMPRQIDQHGTAPGDAMRPDDDGSDLIRRHRARNVGLGPNLRKAAPARQMATVLADIKDPIP